MATSTINGGTQSPYIYRDTALTNTAVTAYNGVSELRGWNITNPNSSEVYVKFYDTTSTVTVGTTAIVKTLYIPANGTVYLEFRKDSAEISFQSALKLACVTTLADSGSTAPSTAVYCEIFYTK